jgi:biopolymer transport protein ExbD
MAEINITPFTDVVLVLLIIFMVTTPLILQSGIKVNLPKASSAEAQSDKNIIVTIDASGGIYIDGKRRLGMNEFKEQLTARLTNKPDAAVIVKGDKEVKYDTIIQVIDTAKESGAKKFALSVELKKEQ